MKALDLTKMKKSYQQLIVIEHVTYRYSINVRIKN